MKMYKFPEALTEGRIVKRKSQFTIDIILNGEHITAHCPTTSRIGDIDLCGVACLVSYNSDPKRKLHYTVEAISCDNPDCTSKKWVGINQVLTNKLVEYFLQTHQLDNMVNGYDTIKREVQLGDSRLDFLVGDTYIEVKTPLTVLNVDYGSHIKVKKQAPFSATDRFVKHFKELASSLDTNQRAILITAYQYEITNVKPRLKSLNFPEVRQIVREAIDKGVETWL